MTTNLNTMLYHAIQVTYRRSVVDHLRSAFQVEYGDSAVQRLRTKYFGGGRWDEMAARANVSQAAGVVRADPIDDFDRIDVASFAPIFEGERRILFPQLSGETGEEWRVRTNGIRRQAELVTSARNPNAHPTSTDISRDDFAYAVENARRVVGHFDPTAEVDLAAALQATDEAPRAPESFLPPSDEIGGTFVGRDAELARLWAWIKDSDARRWLLMGPGGRGKTAIAYEFARQVREASPAGVELIIWLSAKSRSFVEGQVRERSPHFFDLQSALTYILSRTGLAEKGSTAEGDRALTKQLFSNWPALVIVDDVDSLDESQDDAIEFFTEVGFTTRSKILMTSRRPLLGLGLFSTVVPGLTAADAEEFIELRILQYSLDPSLLSKKQRNRIVEVTESSPLYMEDLLRLIATGANVDQSIANWKEHGGEGARRFALGRELDMLGPVAREVLVAAAVPTSAVSLAELRRASNRPSDDVEAALVELRRLFLIPNPQLIDEVEQFSLEANARSLVLDWAARDLPDAAARIRERWKTIARSPSRGRDAAAVSLVRRAEALLAEGDLGEAEKTVLSAIGEMPETPSLHSQLGRIYARWNPPRISEARQGFRRANELGGGDPTLYRDWIAMETKAGELTLAVDAGRLGLSRHQGDAELRLRLANAEWTSGRMQRDHTARMELLDAANATLFPLVGQQLPWVDTAAREQAFFLQAYVAADKVVAIDANEAARSAYSRNPANVAEQREGASARPPASELERVRLRQALNRLAQEFPSDRQLEVALRLRPLVGHAPKPRPKRRKR